MHYYEYITNVLKPILQKNDVALFMTTLGLTTKGEYNAAVIEMRTYLRIAETILAFMKSLGQN